MKAPEEICWIYILSFCGGQSEEEEKAGNRKMQKIYLYIETKTVFHT